MRKLTYFISLSIDGFIAGPGDEVDFFAGSEPWMAWMAEAWGDTLPSHVRAQLGIADAPTTRFDTVVMGRRTYEPALAVGITSPYAHLRQIVASRTLSGLDPAVQFTTEPLETVRALKQEPGLGIYLAGGGRLAGLLLAEIDALVIKRYPVVAGAGKPAFGPDFTPTAFALEDVRSFGSGHIVERYTRA